MIVEICLMALTGAILIFIYFAVQLVKTFQRSVELMNESLDKTKVTMDETNAILKNTNVLTGNLGEVSNLLKTNAQSVDNALAVVKKASAVLDKWKRKKKEKK